MFLHVGHGKMNSNGFHNSNCFDNSETIAVLKGESFLAKG